MTPVCLWRPRGSFSPGPWSWQFKTAKKNKEKPHLKSLEPSQRFMNENFKNFARNFEISIARPTRGLVNWLQSGEREGRQN